MVNFHIQMSASKKNPQFTGVTSYQSVLSYVLQDQLQWSHPYVRNLV